MLSKAAGLLRCAAVALTLIVASCGGYDSLIGGARSETLGPGKYRVWASATMLSSSTQNARDFVLLKCAELALADKSDKFQITADKSTKMVNVRTGDAASYNYMVEIQVVGPSNPESATYKTYDAWRIYSALSPKHLKQ